MTPRRIIFFGSTSDSVIVLEKLRSASSGHVVTLSIVAVVTQPARPVGRKRVLTPTPVDVWGKAHGITVLSFPSDVQKPWLYENEGQIIDALQPLKADLLVSACYGQKIPWEMIKEARFGGLNVHPSLLPRWRGADPVPWAILAGDHQTGVTVVTLSETFDQGAIIAQKKLPIVDTDTSEALRTKLFTIGAGLLITVLPDYLSDLSFPRSFDRLRMVNKVEPRRESSVQKTGSPIRSGMTKRGTQDSFFYARRLTREDGYEPWESIQKAFVDPEEAQRIERKFRAFTPWPGIWTKIKEKRLKILHLSLITFHLSLDLVQLEGKKPVSWTQFASAYF